ncbi:hypothetical protein [Hymenobacter rubripertinctus]|uniref:hypothetical protein n=1 Tax=Hymenobacter rubripertinctus TaxID=2029981 RepID=UPI0011C47036|nr:hypothetical protein [Hymenobacter rubripertinctus]
MKVLVFPVLLAIAIFVGPPESAVSKATALAPEAVIQPPTTPAQPAAGNQASMKKNLTATTTSIPAEALTVHR